jgi:hypothetical protein
VAAHQKGAVNTRAWIVFLDESGVYLLPQLVLFLPASNGVSY